MHVLTGIRVLDLSRRYPGAYTAMFLGDFGAEVIKVDPPHPVFAKQIEEQKFAAFFAPDRNKRSIIIDLKNDRGREVFYRLVKTADVLIEGFRPKVMRRLNADYDTLRKINPRLIYCSLTGFGQDGPYADMPGHDMNCCAIAGALSLIGPRGGTPCIPSNFLADMAGGGLHGAIGILLALMARERSGKGQFVDISLTDGVLSLLAYESFNYFTSGRVPRRGETALTGGAPWAQVFKCKDGEYIIIGCAETNLWKNLCQAVGRKDLIPYHTASGKKADEVVNELAQIFLTRTRDDWFQFLKDKNVPVGPVYYLNETFDDPQVRHRQMVVEFDHPQLGKVSQIGIPIKLTDTPGEIRNLGVPMGSSTQEILSELGYSAEEIEELRQVRAIR